MAGLHKRWTAKAQAPGQPEAHGFPILTLCFVGNILAIGRPSRVAVVHRIVSDSLYFTGEHVGRIDLEALPLQITGEGNLLALG
jgi:hypothetical protein